MDAYSVVILTLNEERNLPRCLASVQACDDVVVLDSGSTDATVEIARRAGARVFTRTFDTFAGQRNFADQQLPFRHPWVFHLDADELFTPELDAECRTAAAARDVDGYFVAPRMLWRGQWIPRCTDFPAWQARFVHASTFQFIDVGHGQREDPAMRMGRFAANYLHDLSAEGTEGWLAKHRRYARDEAEQHALRRGVRWRDLVAADRLSRRRALKHLSYHLPMRPVARFIYQYVLRRGFLEGRAGLEYCRLLATYEGFAAAELRQRRREAR